MSKASRNLRIAGSQAAEIDRLASDARFATRPGRLDHYSRIGAWPGATPGHRVLELGCGPGRYVAMLSSLGCQVTGVDLHRFENWSRIEGKPGVTLISGVQAEALPFADGSFDAV